MVANMLHDTRALTALLNDLRQCMKKLLGSRKVAIYSWAPPVPVPHELGKGFLSNWQKPLSGLQQSYNFNVYQRRI